MVQNRYDTFNCLGSSGLDDFIQKPEPGFLRSVDSLRTAQKEGEKTVVCYVNNINHTNHKDTTWLYDVSFERLNTPEITVVCTGPRAYDLAVRLEAWGL